MENRALRKSRAHGRERRRGHPTRTHRCGAPCSPRVEEGIKPLSLWLWSESRKQPSCAVLRLEERERGWFIWRENNWRSTVQYSSGLSCATRIYVPLGLEHLLLRRGIQQSLRCAGKGASRVTGWGPRGQSKDDAGEKRAFPALARLEISRLQQHHKPSRGADKKGRPRSTTLSLGRTDGRARGGAVSAEHGDGHARPAAGIARRGDALAPPSQAYYSGGGACCVSGPPSPPKGGRGALSACYRVQYVVATYGPLRRRAGVGATTDSAGCSSRPRKLPSRVRPGAFPHSFSLRGNPNSVALSPDRSWSVAGRASPPAPVSSPRLPSPTPAPLWGATPRAPDLACFCFVLRVAPGSDFGDLAAHITVSSLLIRPTATRPERPQIPALQFAKCQSLATARSALASLRISC
jgi:hypothetical protein